MGIRKGIDSLQKINEEKLKWYDAFLKKRTFLLLLIPLSFLLLWIVKRYDWIGEYVFARGIYIPFSKLISFITGLIPFSLMELEIIVLPVIIVICILRFIIKIIIKIHKKDKALYYISKSVLNFTCVLSCLLFFYTALCGVNYHRYSFAKITGLSIEESPVEDLYRLNIYLAKEAASLRDELSQIKGSTDENGLIIVNKSGWDEVAKIANESFEKIAGDYKVLGSRYNSLKTVHFSRFMSKMEITGIFWPFTMEANVNIDVPEYSIPATMIHEMAHQKGFMREDEANFIAYLVCKHSDNLIFRYSGIMLALSYAQNQLYRQNQELYEEVRAIYTEEMKNDLRYEYYYWVQFEDTVISTVSSSMNDTYLKANNQQDGVKSYGRMVDLLLAEYKQTLND